MVTGATGASLGTRRRAAIGANRHAVAAAALLTIAASAVVAPLEATVGIVITADLVAFGARALTGTAAWTFVGASADATRTSLAVTTASV